MSNRPLRYRCGWVVSYISDSVHGWFGTRVSPYPLNWPRKISWVHGKCEYSPLFLNLTRKTSTVTLSQKRLYAMHGYTGTLRDIQRGVASEEPETSRADHKEGKWSMSQMKHSFWQADNKLLGRFRFHHSFHMFFIYSSFISFWSNWGWNNSEPHGWNRKLKYGPIEIKTWVLMEGEQRFHQ